MYLSKEAATASHFREIQFLQLILRIHMETLIEDPLLAYIAAQVIDVPVEICCTYPCGNQTQTSHSSPKFILKMNDRMSASQPADADLYLSLVRQLP
jgi:hypothetical protein